MAAKKDKKNGTVDPRLMAEIHRLADASKNGDLKARANASAFKGDAADILQTINTMLDQALSPLDAQAEVLARMVKGDLSARITANFKGEHNRIKDLINELQEFNQQVVKDIVGVSEKLAAGDLRATLHANYSGDFGRIKDALEAALLGLNNALHQTQSVVEQTGQAVVQVRAVSQDLASNAAEQSSAIEEVTANMTETASQVKANAENTGLANQLVNQTADIAGGGKQKMEAMNQAMNAIAGSSHEIGKIIKVIEEIAFQTNLLALNAAVEAARAGQHGRGFAVVAQEVRNLAGRSAKAAKETAELIENSSKTVAEGVDIAKQTTQSLDEIVLNVVKVKDLIAEISAASEEQAQGVVQVNAAMNQVNA
ncbi:MAG: methyl-accepting chemotaxis protein, partial [Chloroflexi bacterium]